MSPYLGDYVDDYNNAEDAEGPIPPGLYTCRCEDAELKFGKQSGDPFLSIRARIAIGKLKGEALWFSLGFVGNRIRFTKRAVVAVFGEAHDPVWLENNLHAWIGRGVELEVKPNPRAPEYPYVNFVRAADLPGQPTADEQLDAAMGSDGDEDDIPF